MIDRDQPLIEDLFRQKNPEESIYRSETAQNALNKANALKKVSGTFAPKSRSEAWNRARGGRHRHIQTSADC